MTQATQSAGAEALATLNHLERVVDTGQRLRRAKAALSEWDRRTSRVRAHLRQEVAALESEFDALTTAEERAP